MKLHTQVQPVTLFSLDSIYLKKSLFDEQNREISLKVDDLENVDKYLLVFNADEFAGVLTISLNGNIVSSSAVESQSPKPISLPKDWIKSKNTILFEVSGPGSTFWGKNEMFLENIKIIAEKTDLSNQDAKQFFTLTEKQVQNTDFLQVSFALSCLTRDSSSLEIYLNKRQIYTSIPDCENPIHIPPMSGTRLRAGENDLLYKIDKGNYDIYKTIVKLQFREIVPPVYYFQVSEEQYREMKAGKADVNLSLRFPNNIDPKYAVVRVNGVITEIDRYDMLFNKNVNLFLHEGNNAIEIVTERGELNVVEMKVLYIE